MISNKSDKTMQWGQGQSFQVMLGKLDLHVHKNEVEPLPYGIYQN